ELGVRTNADVHVEVAAVTAARRRGAATRQPQPLAVVDTSGDLDLDRAISEHAAFTATVAALRQDALTRSTADTARRCRHDLTEDRAAHLAHLAATTADVTSARVRARLTPRTVAARARDREPHVEGGRRAERGGREVEHDLHLMIGTTCRALGT